MIAIHKAGQALILVSLGLTFGFSTAINLKTFSAAV
jgi:hypothetical protein